MQKMSFVKACKEFFGFKPEQKLAQFAEELKALTAKDRAELSGMFPSVGIEIEDPIKGGRRQ
jgi:hypothetical protein